MKFRENSNFIRRHLAQEISQAMKDGRRLVLMGRRSSGRWTAIRAALPKANITTWDLQYIARETQLEKLPRVSGFNHGLEAALAELDRNSRKSPLVLILRNIDGARGVDAEAAIMGRLRSELQSVQRLRIFYTANDPEFIGRHFGNPTGAFFKQAVLVEVPELADTEIEIWAHTKAKWLFDPSAIRALVNGAGRRAGDVAVTFSTLMEIRNGRPGRVSVAEVQQAIARIIEVRRGSYEDLSTNHLSAVQRCILRAIACGLPAKSSVTMIEATGIAKGPISSTLKNLRSAGWLITKADGGLAIADPFLSGYLVL